MIDIGKLLDITLHAGKVIMGYYESDFSIQVKDDKSPLTSADIAANEYIVNELKKLTPGVGIVSEEGVEREAGDVFWLVDPLDGTKSFISRNGQFTVNIGLVENGRPGIGAVFAPALDALYYTDGKKAYKREKAGMVEIKCRKRPQKPVVVASLSHRTKETDDFIAGLGAEKLIPAASSLKFCVVAEGLADIYPRFGRTMEWDTAAGHAVLRAAGGRVSTLGGWELAYGKAGFENPDFVAEGER